MPRKNPKIGWGPISDDLVKIITKALSSSQTPKKKVLQAQRIADRIAARGGAVTKEGQYITKSMVGNSKRKYAQMFPDEARVARKNVAAHTKPSRIAKASRQKSAAQLKRDKATIARQESDKRIIQKHEKTLRASRAGEAVGEKGTIRRGNREIPVSKKRQTDIERQGRLASSQSKKGNAKNKAKAAELDANIKNAKNATERRAALQKRRQFRNDTGF